jgi:hypothetical protein
MALLAWAHIDFLYWLTVKLHAPVLFREIVNKKQRTWKMDQVFVNQTFVGYKVFEY